MHRPIAVRSLASVRDERVLALALAERQRLVDAGIDHYPHLSRIYTEACATIDRQYQRSPATRLSWFLATLRHSKWRR